MDGLEGIGGSRRCVTTCHVWHIERSGAQRATQLARSASEIRSATRRQTGFRQLSAPTEADFRSSPGCMGHVSEKHSLLALRRGSKLFSDSKIFKVVLIHIGTARISECVCLRVSSFFASRLYFCSTECLLTVQRSF